MPRLPIRQFWLSVVVLLYSTMVQLRSEEPGLVQTSSVVVMPCGVERIVRQLDESRAWGWTPGGSDISVFSAHGRIVAKTPMPKPRIRSAWPDDIGNLWVDVAVESYDALGLLVRVDAKGQITAAVPLPGPEQQRGMSHDPTFVCFGDRRHAIYAPRTFLFTSKPGGGEEEVDWLAAFLIDYTETSVRAVPIIQRVSTMPDTDFAVWQPTVIDHRYVVLTSGFWDRNTASLRISTDGTVENLIPLPTSEDDITSTVIEPHSNGFIWIMDQAKGGIVSVRNPSRRLIGSPAGQWRCWPVGSRLASGGGDNIYLWDPERSDRPLIHSLSSQKTNQDKQPTSDGRFAAATARTPEDFGGIGIKFTAVGNDGVFMGHEVRPNWTVFLSVSDDRDKQSIVVPGISGGAKLTFLGSRQGAATAFKKSSRAWVATTTQDGDQADLQLFEFDGGSLIPKWSRRYGELDSLSTATAGDESNWWALAKSRDRVWLVNVSGELSKEATWSEIRADRIAIGATDNAGAWVWSPHSVGLWYLDGSKPQSPRTLHVFPSVTIRERDVLPSNNGKQAYVRVMTGRRADSYYSVVQDSAVGALDVWVSGTRLENRAAGATGLKVLQDGAIEVRLFWFDEWIKYKHDGRLVVSFVSEDGEVFKSEITAISSAMKLAFPVGWKPLGKWRTEVEFTDDQGTRLTWRLPTVEFIADVSLLLRPWVLSSLLFFGIVIVVFATQRSRADGGWIGIYLPLAVTFGLAIVARTSASVDVFVILTSGGLVIALVIGYVSPDVFRDLARMSPFNLIVPHLVHFPKVRKKLFRDYAQITLHEMSVASLLGSSRDKRTRRREIYTPVPASIWVKDAQTLTPKPAEKLVDHLLAAGDEPGSVFIYGPGGRGKSALLREVVKELLLRFERGGNGPLPVLVSSAGDIDTAISAKLGNYLIWPERLASDLKQGSFLVVIDGLSEIGLTPDSVEEFRRKHESRLQLLVSTRSEDDVIERLKARPVDLLAEPCRLDKAALAAFEEVYLGERKELAESVRRACQASDGTYSPILVRLACIDPSEHIGGIAGIYDGAFRLLVGQQNENMRKKTADLCVKTHWKTGERSFAADESDADLCVALEQAGVLYEIRPPRGSSPRILIFFHDSMQSYLTAIGLRELNPLERYQALLRAAGWENFRRHRSDLVAFGGSELFQMCVQTFPRLETCEHLTIALTQWAEIFGPRFSTQEILDPIPPITRIRLDPHASAKEVLLNAIGLCIELDSLSAIYGNLAGKAYLAEKECRSKDAINPNQADAG